MTTGVAAILAAAKQRSGRTNWLVTSTEAAAAEARAFLDRALGHLPANVLARVQKRLQRSDAKGIDAVLHELLAFEVCRSLGMEPTFEPEAGNQRPDLSFQINNTTVWADVLVTYRPTSTLRTLEGLHGYEDAGQSAKKIGDAIAGKAVKYASLNAPLIVFVMFGEYTVHLHDLETALYGATVAEISMAGLSSVQCHEDWQKHGLLCPPSADAPHRSLSAVVSGEWFDTLNGSARGQRLRYVVYHHWQPRFPIPVGAFNPFCDLYWRLDDSASLIRPQMSGDSTIVMSTTSDDPPRFAPYSTQRPW